MIGSRCLCVTQMKAKELAGIVVTLENIIIFIIRVKAVAVAVAAITSLSVSEFSRLREYRPRIWRRHTAMLSTVTNAITMSLASSIEFQ